MCGYENPQPELFMSWLLGRDLMAMKLKTRTVRSRDHLSTRPGLDDTGRTQSHPCRPRLPQRCHLSGDRFPDTVTFRRLLRDGGVKPVMLPARSPNLNAL